MAKFFFTSGRIRPEIKKRSEYDVKPIRPQYSEMGGANSGTNAGYSGGSANGGALFVGAQAQNAQNGGAAHQHNGSLGGYYQPKNAENGASGGDGGNTPPANGYDAGSFEDYYSRLIAALHSYGIDMALPTLDELYNQPSSFLRPSVDAAIAGRQRYGETVMAELDADAYSRGMGSSSYLSSMKNREYDDIANDISAMESSYNSTLAEYLYNASNELANIQAQFAAMNREHELEMQRQLQQQAYESERLRQQQEFERSMRASGGSGGSGTGFGSGSGRPKLESAGSGGSGGASASSTGSSSHYYNYTVYLNSLSSSDRSNVFNSNSSYWTAIRDELRRNLSTSQYEQLRAAFDPNYSGGGGGASSGQTPGRGWNVNTTN